MAVALMLLWGTGCGPKPGTGAPPPNTPAKAVNSDSPGMAASAGEVTFTTSDSWTLHADYTAVPAARKAVVLLHQRGGSAADWQPILLKLAGIGLSVLAVDQRGFGRSAGSHAGEDPPWDTTHDIEAAIQWLGTKGFKPGDIGLAGASYGANNALIYAAAHPETPAVALLSPGKDYHGLKLEPAARLYKGRLLLLHAKDDSITQSGPDLLMKVSPGKPEMEVFSGNAHGTELFALHPESTDTLRSFFARL